MGAPADTASLPADREARLDQVLADYLAAVAAGAAPARDELLAAHPDLADELLDFFADQERFRDEAAPLRAAVGPAPRPPLPTQVGPYEILGEIARGGMGVVLRARHRTHGRVVALKLLAAGAFAGEAEVQRFRREARAVARLDHPHIVPVYEVDEHAGLPYFTMKLLPGNLAQALRRGPLVPRAAAALVGQIARAAHYAHQRGILHRDLKPANVLLQREEGASATDDLSTLAEVPQTSPPAPLYPLIADFGLARPADASTLTSTGAVVGTPAYVSPEQALGHHDEVTVASDVYGLGAILYECLAGRPPFKAATPIETLRLVIDSEPAAPRSLRPGLDADFETICLKCLRKTPAERYASAAELADDLERYGKGEGIRARPLSLAARLWRGVKRQPVVAALVAALVVAMAVGFGLVLLQWLRAEANLALANQQRDRTWRALADAEEARSQAEAHLSLANRQRDEIEAALAGTQEARNQAEASFRQAHAAVNEFCVEVSDDLRDRPGLQQQYRKLVQSARLYYQDFLRHRGNDPALRRELADTHVRVAQIVSRIGERREALAAYHEALAIYRQLHEEAPDDPVIQRKLAGTLSNVATLQELSEGLKTSAEALRAYRRFAAARPADLDLAAGLALALGNRGAKFIGLGRFDEAAECLAEAATMQEDLARRYPWNDPLWSELAGTLDNYGVLLARQDRYGESLCCHLRTQQLREKLAARKRDDVPRRSALAAARHHVGIALRDAGQPDAAREAFDDALAARRQIAQSNPLVIRYQVDYALSLSNRGQLYNQEGKRTQGLNCYHQARQIYERQLVQDPGSPGLRKVLAEAWYNVGVTHGALNRRKDEGDAFARARKIQEELVRAAPDNVEYRVELGRTLNNLGINLWVRKQEDESKEVLRQAIESTGKLVKQSPQVLAYRRLLNNHHGVLAEIEWRLGNAETSAEQVYARIALWDNQPKEFFNAGCELARLAALGSVTAEQRRRFNGDALESLRKAVGFGYNDVKRLRDHADLAALQGVAEFEKIVEMAEGRESRWTPGDVTMAIAIRCPDCGKSYNLSDEQAGHRVRCRACNSDFDVTNRVETLETVPTDAVAERRGEKRPARFDAPERQVRKKSRKLKYLLGALAALLLLLFLGCGGAVWVVSIQTRKGFAQARAQLLADLARANEEARRAERGRETADQERLKAELARQQEMQGRVKAENDLRAALARLGAVRDKIPDLAPIKDLDDALAKLKAKDSLTKIKAMSWITEHSPYNAQQKKRVLDALRPLTMDEDPMVKAGAVQTQLIVEQDL